MFLWLSAWRIRSTPLCSPEQICLTKKRHHSYTIQTGVFLFSRKNSCHCSYSADLHVLTSVLFLFSPLLPCCPLLSFFPSSPQKSVKEGILLKQTSSFQRWKRRYFKLRGRTLYYAKDCKVQECVKRFTAALSCPLLTVEWFIYRSRGNLSFVFLAISLLFLMRWTYRTPVWLRPAPRTSTTASRWATRLEIEAF